MERSSLCMSCTPCLPPRGPRPEPVTPRRSSSWSLASASTGQSPGPARLLEAKVQPDGRGPGLGRQPGPGRASPHCSPLSKTKAQVPRWSDPWLAGEAFAPGLLPHKPRNRTQVEPTPSSQLPLPLHKSEPRPRRGRALHGPHGGREGQSCSRGGPEATVAWGGAVPSSQNARPLWSRQAAWYQAGRKQARQRHPQFPAPQHSLQRGKADQSRASAPRLCRAAFIWFLLAASFLMSLKHCLLANGTQIPPTSSPSAGQDHKHPLALSPQNPPDEHEGSRRGGSVPESGCLSTHPLLKATSVFLTHIHALFMFH